MDTISKARHEAEVADVSERKLRVKSLELAVSLELVKQPVEPGKSGERVLQLAEKFLNFLIGLDPK